MIRTTNYHPAVARRPGSTRNRGQQKLQLAPILIGSALAVLLIGGIILAIYRQHHNYHEEVEEITFFRVEGNPTPETSADGKEIPLSAVFTQDRIKAMNQGQGLTVHFVINNSD